MVIFHDNRRFELTVEASDEMWGAKCVGVVPGELLPRVYLWHVFPTRQAAIVALEKKWQALFPDAAPLVWRDPPTPPLVQRPSGSRPASGGPYDPR